MTISTFERNATIAEMAVEIDRRGAVIEKLEAALLSERHRAEEAKWLTMDSAPKTGRPFLVTTSYAPNPVHEASWDRDAQVFLFAGGTICANAIGWMPMPLPLTPEPTHER